MDSLIHPLSCCYVVKTCDDHTKVFVKFSWHILNLTGVMLNFDTWNTLHHELSSNLCFVLIHILFSEKELTVQVGKIDCIHINHSDILDSAKSKIF